MRKILLLMLLSCSVAYSQNTFPASGNVGIGTTSPGAKLSFTNVDGTSLSDGITWYNPTPLVYGIYRTAGGWASPNYQQLKLSFETGIILDPGSLYGKSYVDVQGGGLRVSSGNVGIGTSAPNSTLAVKGRVGIRADANPTAVSETLRIEGGIAGEENVVNVTNLADQDFAIRLSGAGAATKRTIIGPSVATRFSLGVGVTSGNEHLTIISGGNVGVGTTSPLSKLHINSSIERETFRVYKQGNTANYLSFWQGTGAGAIDPIGTGALYLGYDQPTNVFMGITGAAVNIGNVGIGTTTPDAKLAVKGQIHAQEVKVDLLGSIAPPDYVFASNYQLPTLDYIKTYIDQNKHLPEVPSAKDIEANGVNLGEMNMLLLKKIEELTLHLISQEKRIKELEKNNK